MSHTNLKLCQFWYECDWNRVVTPPHFPPQAVGNHWLQQDTVTKSYSADTTMKKENMAWSSLGQRLEAWQNGMVGYLGTGDGGHSK